MPVYDAMFDAEGRLVLPRELADWIGARPGRTLDVAKLRTEGDESAPSLSLRIASHPEAYGATGKPGGGVEQKVDSIFKLQDIAREARANGAVRSAAEDPIGDFLIAEDERSRNR